MTYEELDFIIISGGITLDKLDDFDLTKVIYQYDINFFLEL